MSLGNYQRGKSMWEINVTPLVDVMLVLLVIFMVTTPLITQGITVKLPQASPREIDIDESYVITITAKGNYYFNKDLVTLKELKRRLLVFAERGYVKTVFLRADKRVPYGVVVAAMDSVKQAGIEQLGIVTELYDSDLE